MDSPGVLYEESLVLAVHVAFVTHAIFPGVIAVLSANLGEAATGKGLSPVDQEVSIGEIIRDFIVQTGKLISAFKCVLAPDIGSVQVEILSCCDVFLDTERAGHVLEV